MEISFSGHFQVIATARNVGFEKVNMSLDKRNPVA